MSSGYRRSFGAAGRCLIAAWFLATPIAHAQPVSGNGGNQASTQAGQAVVAPDANPSLPPALQYEIDRIARALESANQKEPSETERRRTEDDLQAQKNMAFWAMLMFWAATFEAGITGYGVFLVARTLKATWATKDEAKRAADAAHSTLEQSERHARQQLRAYLSMAPDSLGGLYEGGTANIGFLPTNHGQTPAYSVKHTFKIAVIVSDHPRTEKLPPATTEISTEFTVFPDGPDKTWFGTEQAFTAEEIQAIAAGLAKVHIWGTTRYRDAFDKDRYVNFSAYAGSAGLIARCIAVRDTKVDPGSPDWTWGYGHGHNTGD